MSDDSATVAMSAEPAPPRISWRDLPIAGAFVLGGLLAYQALFGLFYAAYLTFLWYLGGLGVDTIDPSVSRGLLAGAFWFGNASVFAVAAWRVARYLWSIPRPPLLHDRGTTLSVGVVIAYEVLLLAYAGS